MTNYQRLRLELSEKDYFSESQSVYEEILEENDLDPYLDYDKENDQINMLESVYAILQMLSNNIELYTKVETEFVSTTAAYQYLQQRLEDLRDEIDRVKSATGYTDSDGNTSGLITHMFYNDVIS